MSERADVIYYQNNGVTAVKPVPGGRLDKLVRRAKSEKVVSPRDLEQMWVFADLNIWHDEQGNTRLDHHRRGIMCGTYYDGQEFLVMCRRLGLCVEYTGFFVPFSNGQRHYGTFADGVPCADYLESELRLARFDLPDEETLRELLTEFADAPAAQPPA